MNDQDLVGQSCDELVSLPSGFDGWSPGAFFKRGKNKEAAGKSATPLRWEPDFIHRASEANDNGLLAAQENSEAVLFNWRVKATDDCHPLVAELPSGVMGPQNDISGSAGGAEQRCLAQGQEIYWTNHVQLMRSIVTQPYRQFLRPASVGRHECRQAGTTHSSLLSPSCPIRYLIS